MFYNDTDRYQHSTQSGSTNLLNGCRKANIDLQESARYVTDCNAAEAVSGFLALNDSDGLQADVCIAPKQSLKNVGLTRL